MALGFSDKKVHHGGAANDDSDDDSAFGFSSEDLAADN